jgi:CBS domain-containing protein
MTIQAILDRKGSNVFTIDPTATVKNAVDQMLKRNVAALVVRSNDAIMGIVSERNVVSAISRFGQHALAMAVKDIFTSFFIAVTPDDSIKKAMGLMTNHRLRHLLVITDGGLVGIVSIGDVIKHRLGDLETEANVLRDLYVAAR